ncbi:hypothetical protein GCM10023238_09390 [Streptomyces heliomycini]
MSAFSGYALAVYRFRGRETLFNVLLAGVLMPPVILAIPQYLLLAKADLTDSYLAVLLPQILSPYGVYLARIYAAAAVPADVVEAGRMDGAGEWRIFSRVALPMMAPGLVTVFLFQFVAIWNNFLLPYIMLSDDEKFPITLGLYTLLEQGANTPALYTLVITGAFLAVFPLVALFLVIQRFWSLDLLSGAVSHDHEQHGGQAQAADDPRRGARGRCLARHRLTGAQRRPLRQPRRRGRGQRRDPQDGLRRQPARPLADHGRSDSVGFLLTEPQERFFEDPNFNVLLRGCTQALAAHDVPLLLMLAGTDDERGASRGTSPPGTSTGCCWCPATPATRWRRSCGRRACRWSRAGNRSGWARR